MKSTAEKQHNKQITFSIKLNRFVFKLFGRLFPQLMSWWACKLWSRTRHFPTSHRENRMQLRASECSLNVNGKQIKTWMWGEGPIILLIHGWNGYGLQLSRLIDPLLKAGYQVICFDAPAHGQTDGKHTHLLEIRDVILALPIYYGSIHSAIAHSFGVACLSAAIDSGMSIPNIVSISSPGGLSNLIARYCQHMHIPPATETQLRSRLKQRTGEELWQRFAESYPLSHGVERSLIIHDKDDRLVKWQESERLAKCWPNAKLLLTHGLGHQRILLDSSIHEHIVSFIENKMTYDSIKNG